MRVRRFELRLIALALVALWTAAAALVVWGYRPGGPYDLLVGLATVPFVLVALLALVWPPIARPGGPFLIAVALGAGATLLLLPSIGGVVVQLQAGGPQTLLPSLEAVYPWALALLATAAFAGIGLARRLYGPAARRRRRLAGGALIGMLAAAVAGGTFAAVAIANELAIADRPSSASRYGPIDGGREPQACQDPLTIPGSAAFAGPLGGTVDRASIGSAQVRGQRVGDDFRWDGTVASDEALGRYGAIRIGFAAWTAQPREAWHPAAPFAVEDLDLDRRFVEVALSPERTSIAQELGLAIVGGATARHCRIATDGAIVSEALPIARWIVGPSDIDRWRGEIDYYVFLDGAVGIASGAVNGEAFVLDRPGLLGTFTFEMSILDRGADLTIRPPL
jgi:hypothetical protein